MKKVKIFIEEIDKPLDFTIFILCIVGIVAEMFCPASSPLGTLSSTPFETVFGLAGLAYCLYHTCVFFFSPIKRDWILTKGRFLLKVVNYVLLVPFILVSGIHIHEKCTKEEYSPKNLFYEENLYTYSHADIDTLGLAETASTEEWELNAHDLAIKDSVIIRQEKLPASISKTQEDPTLFWTIYCHFIDPGNQHMTTSVSGRRTTALVSTLGFFLLNGLLISMLISWFDRRREQWQNGDIRYGLLAFMCKRVAVVIGANESSPIIIKKLLMNLGEKPVNYVILLTNEDVKKVREQIASYLTDSEKRRVIIYNGQLDSIEEIYKLSIKRATEIYVLGECSNDDISQSYHDTQNMRCVHNIASYLTDKCVERKIVCRVLFEYQTTYSVFQFSDLPENIRQHLVFIPFNTYENWAQRVLVKGEYSESVKKILPAMRRIDMQPTMLNSILHPIINLAQSMMPKNNDEERKILYTPLDGSGIGAKSKEHVHFIVVGMSKMGIAMAIQAAQVAHYPNFSTGKKDENGNIVRNPSLIRTKITFIDSNADKEMDFFMGRHQNLFALSRHRYIDASNGVKVSMPEWSDPMLDNNNEYKMQGENFIDTEWEFVKGGIECPAVTDYLKEAAAMADKRNESHSLLTIAICHPLAHEAIASALYMPGEIYDNAQQILVYQREASDIVYNLSSKDDIYTSLATKYKRYTKLRPFGMKYADFTMDKSNYYKAQLCNYVYTLIFDKNIDNSIIPQRIESMQISKKNEENMLRARSEWKKLPIFNKWSNRYLANSFESKLRSIGANYDDINLHYSTMCSLFEKNKEYMAECEHNRWNVQQLLMGFRAYKDSELKEFRRLQQEKSSDNNAQAKFKEFKEKMKASPEKLHLNICSVSLLNELDSAAEEYDRILNSSIPAISKCIETHNKRTNKNA